MFANAQQSGFISIFYSVGSNPLALWDKQVKNGHIRRVIDEEVKSLVLDIGGTNVATTYITCPINPRASLGIKMPYMIMLIKNMKKFFSFEIQILDDKDMRRRFRVSNFQSTTKVRPFCTSMPIGLTAKWNEVIFNLADFTKRAYASTYIETIRVQIHANTRIRRIYFTDQIRSDEDLPNEFKLFAPGSRETKPKASASKEIKKASREAVAVVPEAAAEPPVPYIKLDEEVPPPPTPAEESPIDTAELRAEVTTTPAGETEIDLKVAESELETAAEVEAPPAESAEEAEVKPEEVEEVAPIEEGEAPPAEEGQVEIVEVAEPAEEVETVPVEEGAPAETGTASGEPSITEAVAEEAAVSSEAPTEGEIVKEEEASEPPSDVETGFTSEATEGETSPDEMPTATDEGEP
ncbi:unnamed protein product [Ceutorhynchus assimilis]|uniref:CFA20 domain-containing protein n=1 Tax=Ceutorhynchus assimilis TaxID=467358 RepID=A0A9N9MSL1_9CUCU|nr:unnamed protein product [Ceutorhynchus assimilis]